MYSDENTSTVVTHVLCRCANNPGENKFPFPQNLTLFPTSQLIENKKLVFNLAVASAQRQEFGGN